MKRYGLILAALGILAGIGWALHGAGEPAEADPKDRQLKNADALDTSAGWRYRQSQPHHWRYIMLKK